MSSSNPAKGLRSEHYIIKETVAGTTPTSPTLYKLRSLSGTPVLNGDPSISQELTGKRDYNDFKMGTLTPNIEFSCEFSAGAYSDIIEAALGGTKTTNATDSGVTVTVSASGKTFTRSAGDYTAKTQVGAMVYFPDLTGDNKGPWPVKAVTATVITVDDPRGLLADESSATTDVTYSTSYEVGQNYQSFTIISYFPDSTDTNKYSITRGVEIATASIDFQPNSRVTFNFTAIGRTHEDAVALPSGATLDPAPTDEQSFHFVEGALFIGGAGASYASASISLDNAASAQQELGCGQEIAFIERGRMTNTVSISGMFRNSTEINKFRAGTASVMTVSAADSLGNAFSAYLPIVHYTQASKAVEGEASITETLECQALGDGGSVGSITIHEIEAA